MEFATALVLIRKVLEELLDSERFSAASRYVSFHGEQLVLQPMRREDREIAWLVHAIAALWRRIKLDVRAMEVKYHPVPDIRDRGIKIERGITNHPNHIQGYRVQKGLMFIRSHVEQLVFGGVSEQEFREGVRVVLVDLLVNPMSFVKGEVRRLEDNLEFWLDLYGENIWTSAQTWFTWAGFDFDGYKYTDSVTGRTVLAGARLLRDRAIGFFQGELRSLSQRVDVSQFPTGLELMLQRVDVKLEATRSGLRVHGSGYASPADLVTDLESLRESVEHRDRPRVSALIHRAEVFGVSLLTPHPRFHSVNIGHLIADLVSQNGWEYPEQEEARASFLHGLIEAVQVIRPKLYVTRLSKEAAWVYDLLTAIKKVGELNGRLPLVLLSGTETLSQILELRLALDLVGLPQTFAVPIFESESALVNTEKIFRGYIQVLKSMKRVPTHMPVSSLIGLSDSARDAGIVAATVRVVEASEACHRVSEEEGLPGYGHYFGGGQVFARGGIFPLRDFVARHMGTPETIWMTIQGDDITRALPTRHRSRRLPAILPAGSNAEFGWTRAAMPFLWEWATRSLMNYRRITSGETFGELVRSGTVAAWMDSFHTRARPRRRVAEDAEESASEFTILKLRAIGTVLIAIPSLGMTFQQLGAGTALQELFNEGREEEFRHAFATSPLVRWLVVEMARGYAFADLDGMRELAVRVPESARHILSFIEEDVLAGRKATEELAGITRPEDEEGIQISRIIRHNLAALLSETKGQVPENPTEALPYTSAAVALLHVQALNG